MVGCGCLGVGATALIWAAVERAQLSDWYPYKPTDWVIADLRSANPQVADRARKELRARYKRGRMSPDQIHRFGEAEYPLSLKVRPTLTVGHIYDIEIVVSSCSYLPSGAEYWPSVYCTGSRRGGQPLRVRWKSEGLPRIRGSLIFDRPGQDELQFDVVVRWGAADDRPHSLLKILKATVDVRPQGGDDDVKVVQSPEIDAVIRRAVTVERIIVPDIRPFYLDIRVSSVLPVALACDALIDLDGELKRLGSYRISRTGEVRMWDRSTAWQSIQQRAAQMERVNVILRCSKHVARDTVDIFETWGGELQFRGVEVAHSHYGQ